MDKTKITRVENVTLERSRQKMAGDLQIRPHHLVFRSIPPQTRSNHRPAHSPGEGAAVPPGQHHTEIWITYPMIYSCSFRSNPRGPSIFLRCRDFTFFTFHFLSELAARDAWDAIKSLSCNLGRIEKLYAFTYIPKSPEGECKGWKVYDFHKEMRRLGIDKTSSWRISSLNENYKYIDTYPSHLVIPSYISDSTLQYALPYRSRHRVPVLTYLHTNKCSLTRSSQPMAGLGRGKRNQQDETLVTKIFETTANIVATEEISRSVIVPSADIKSTEDLLENLELEDASVDHFVNSQTYLRAENVDRNELIKGPKRLNLIADARPRLNAMANHAIGRGSENMEHYPQAVKTYLGIANIHAMRNSLAAVYELLRDADASGAPLNRSQLARTNWLTHISSLIEGTDTVARQIGLNYAHVLIHCSDGWDRTSQLCALTQLCLDPYYRTFEGFMVLVEKDWLSFGHRFHDRTGFMGDERKFEVDSDWASNAPNGSANPIDSAFNKMKAFFNSKSTEGRDGIDSDDDILDGPGGWWSDRSNSSVKPDEISPIFHQFLDATYQLMYQHPDRFEFNERFLRRLLYHAYSCQYGTFLFNTEKERVEAKAHEKTRSVWDYFLARKKQFLNSDYNPRLNSSVQGRGPLIFYNLERGPRWWSQLFRRMDDEMNGPSESKRLGTNQSVMNLGPLMKMASFSVLGQSAGEQTDGQDLDCKPQQTNEAPALDNEAHFSTGQASACPGRTQSPLRDHLGALPAPSITRFSDQKERVNSVGDTTLKAHNSTSTFQRGRDEECSQDSATKSLAVQMLELRSQREPKIIRDSSVLD